GAVADEREVLAGARVRGDGREPGGAEDVGRGQEARDQVIVGEVRRRDEGAVGKRNAQQLGLRSQRTHRDAVDAGALVAGPADLAGVVGSPERADDELAGTGHLYLRPDLID